MAEYSYTSYGSAGPTDGGGFLANGDSSSQNPNAARRDYGHDTLRPVTIKQIVDAQQPHPDADFIVDGTPIAQITFIGRIRNVVTQATNHTYSLDDGTGAVDVKQWIESEVTGGGMDIDGEGEGAIKNKPTEGVYARVYGNLKQFNNKRHVGARTVRAVTDYNEVQCHLLDATVVHLNLTKGPVGQGLKTANGDAAMQGIEMSRGMGQEQSGGKNLPVGMSATAKKVYKCLNESDQSNEGLHMQDIAGRLGIRVEDVAKGGDELLDSGLVYTTVDDQTWAILDDL